MDLGLTNLEVELAVEVEIALWNGILSWSWTVDLTFDLDLGVELECLRWNWGWSWSWTSSWSWSWTSSWSRTWPWPCCVVFFFRIDQSVMTGVSPIVVFWTLWPPHVMYAYFERLPPRLSLVCADRQRRAWFFLLIAAVIDRKGKFGGGGFHAPSLVFFVRPCKRGSTSTRSNQGNYKQASKQR